MKTKNRVFAILLAFAIVITYMPALAFANDVDDTAESEPVVSTEAQLPGEEEQEESPESQVSTEDVENTEKEPVLSKEGEETLKEETAPALREIQGKGDEEESRVKRTLLTLSPDRGAEDKTLWGYVGTKYPENYPMDGDIITVEYASGIEHNYVCNDEGTFSLRMEMVKSSTTMDIL